MDAQQVVMSFEETYPKLAFVFIFQHLDIKDVTVGDEVHAHGDGCAEDQESQCDEKHTGILRNIRHEDGEQREKVANKQHEEA
ncbi:hypothetical protein [Methylobacillus flagellatus]|uniref:hypothetical protein n=1 Tax=Methylobacillus flagellatus TaxID=405 RepID=UPI001E6408B4|nr:hypothetical protein [Methylobacillus flagellatus]